MKQTRIESLLEKTVDTASAMLISYLVWKYMIRPNMDMLSDFIVVFVFTVISMIRGYVWRRFFNADLHKAVHKFVSRRAEL